MPETPLHPSEQANCGRRTRLRPAAKWSPDPWARRRIRALAVALLAPLAASTAAWAQGPTLEEAPPPLAERVATLEGAYRHLATKEDLAQLRGEMARFRAETRADIAKLRAGTKADIAKLRAETREDLHRAVAGLHEAIAQLGASSQRDIARLRTDLTSRIAVLEGGMAVLLLVLATIAGMVGVPMWGDWRRNRQATVAGRLPRPTAS